MGTTRIKVIDLSSGQKEIKTSRKHARLASQAKLAEKLAGAAKLKTEEREVKKTKTQEPKISKQEPQTGELSKETKPAEEKVSEEAKKPAAPKPQSPKAKPKQAVHKRGKNYQQAAKLIEKESYPVTEAIDLLFKTATTKFDPTVEVHFNVTDKNVKAQVSFPHSIGAKKEKKYLVFGEKKSQDLPNIIWADEKTIPEIENGKLKPKRDFDVVISTPKFMPSLAKVAKILGPAGLMPNPKNQTVIDDPIKAIKTASAADTTDFRTDPTAPILHTKIGKLSLKQKALEENMQALILAIGINKIKKATLKSSMSPAIKLDLSTIAKK